MTSAAPYDKIQTRMPYALDPMVAGELGEETELDPSMQHPPLVTAVEYVLDRPDPDDLIESFRSTSSARTWPRAWRG